MKRLMSYMPEYNEMMGSSGSYGIHPPYEKYGPKRLTEREKHSLKEEICSLRHNLSVEKKENEELRETMKLCVVASEKILLENKKLKIEVEKVHSRFEILDL